MEKLLVECLNMLRALQYAGSRCDPGYSEYTPGYCRSDLCPTCTVDLDDKHMEDCELWNLIKKLEVFEKLY